MNYELRRTWKKIIEINVTVLSKYLSNKNFRRGSLEYEAIS